MKFYKIKNYLFIILIVVGKASANTGSEETYKTIQSIRLEIPKDLPRQLTDGSQNLIGRCGFVHLTGEHDRQLDRMVSTSLSIKIPVAFHVIYATIYDESGNLFKEGYVDEYLIERQIEILNNNYSGKGVEFFL